MVATDVPSHGKALPCGLRAPLREHFSALPRAWKALLDGWLATPESIALCRFVDARIASGATIYPPAPLRAFELTAPDQARVVILGQDPYHGPGQAHGLAFSVLDGARVPPSLRNIQKEVQRSVGGTIAANGNLESWARQGVLLLNAVLTVEEGKAGSHAGCGWEGLTGAVVDALARAPGERVFMLWGAQAQARRPAAADPLRHLILEANHPSPLSARRGPVPFSGCGHFARTNEFLRARGHAQIRWQASGLDDA